MPSHDVKNIPYRTAILFTKSAFFTETHGGWLSIRENRYQSGPSDWEVPAWYRSVYQPGIGRFTISLIPVGTCRDTSLTLFGIPAWYRSVYQPSIGWDTSLVLVGTPAWYLSGYQPGIGRDTSLVLVGTPAWYLSQHQPGIGRDTSLVSVGIPACYRSGYQPGIGRDTSLVLTVYLQSTALIV